MEAGFRIVVDDSPSIKQLQALQAEGVSVMRSAHCGNLSPYNLALAQAGFQMYLLDHNITGVDGNYRPETIDNGRGPATIVAAGDRLVSRVPITAPPAEVSQLVVPGAFLDEVHIAAARAAVPDGDFFSSSQYYRRNAGPIGEMVAIVADEFPEEFERIVMPDGSVSKQPWRAAALGRYRGVVQLADDYRAETEAAIMPNSLNILATSISETLLTGRNFQYHLSGPDMVRYAGRMQPRLDRLYETIRRRASFGASLPQDLEFRLVPTTAARLATTVERQPHLDELIETIRFSEADAEQIIVEKAAFFKANPTADGQTKFRFAQPYKDREQATTNRLAASLAEVPEIFAAPGDEGFVSQYTAIEQGGVYSAPINSERSFADLAKVTKRLQAAAKGKKE